MKIFIALGHMDSTQPTRIKFQRAAKPTPSEQRREKTRALKQAMMQELLTGKTRLL